MSLLEELKGLGVDVNDGLERVMGDQDLYEMMLGMFIDSVRDNAISLEEFDGDSLDKLIERVHMLKGVTGNLAMTPLFLRYTEVLGQLRAGQVAEAKAGFARIVPVQQAILDCIQRYSAAQ